jgi:galactonate dehydratase
MKIVAVTAHRFYGSHRSWIFTEVETDEGITGISEVFVDQEFTLLAAIQELGSTLVGRNPTDIEYHWEHIRRNTHWRGPIWYTALSALEIAMWDILGQWLGVPVYKLFGGPCRAKVRVYAHVRPTTPPGRTAPESFAEAAKRQVQRGYSALKVGPLGYAGRFALADDSYPQPPVYLSSALLDAAREHIGAIRDAVGPQVDLAIDCGGRFRPADAIRLVHELEEFRPMFVEEPVPPEDIESLVTVMRAVRVPLATGERLYTRFQYTDLLARHAVDIVQPDPINAGGLAETRRIAEMAHAFNIVVAPHNPNGPVALAQAVHVCAAISNFLILESPGQEEFIPLAGQAVLEPLVETDGTVELPAKPGLGVALNKEGMARRERERPVDALSGSPGRRWGAPHEVQPAEKRLK